MSEDRAGAAGRDEEAQPREGASGQDGAKEGAPGLAAHPFLHGLSAEQIGSIAPRAVSFPAGAVLFRENEEARAFYLLVSGRVALDVYVPARGPARVESLGAGDLLGLSWLFPPHRWQAEARAIEPVEAFEVDAAQLRARMQGDASLGCTVAMHLVRRLYERLERVRLQRLDVYRAEGAALSPEDAARGEAAWPGRAP